MAKEDAAEEDIADEVDAVEEYKDWDPLAAAAHRYAKGDQVRVRFSF